MKKGVQKLELDFLDYPAQSTPVHYSISQSILGFRNGSGLNPMCSDIPSEYVGFKSLKVLDLKSVDVTGIVLEYIISSCPVLERLSVSDSSKLVELRVISPSTALKYLVIQRCNNIKKIEISIANLVSFLYDADGALTNRADKVDLLLKDLPLLVEVSLGAIHCSPDFLEVASQIYCCLAELEILKLNNLSAWYKSESFSPILSNLKHLEIKFDEDDKCGLLLLASFIEASPLLHTLVLQLNLHVQLRKGPFISKKAVKCSHHNLKMLEIISYEGTKRQIELVKYMKKTAIKLEKIVFNSVRRGCYRSRVDRLDPRIDHGAWHKDWFSSNARKIKKMFPASVEVVSL